MGTSAFASGPFFLTAAQTLKQSTMSHGYFTSGKQLVVASALVFSTSGVALADDSGRSPFSADSHVTRATPAQAATASAGRIKKEDELSPEQKIRLARAELTVTLLRLFSASKTGQ